MFIAVSLREKKNTSGKWGNVVKQKAFRFIKIFKNIYNIYITFISNAIYSSMNTDDNCIYSIKIIIQLKFSTKLVLFKVHGRFTIKLYGLKT